MTLHRIDNDGLELALTDEGAGPDVLFVHGLGSAAEMWDDYVAALASDYRCWRLDLRGHGASAWADSYRPSAYASDVTAALDHIGRPTIGVGHSLGGRSLVQAADHELLRSLYIVDSSLIRMPGAQSPAGALFVRIAAMIRENRAADRPVADYIEWLGGQAYPGGGTTGDAFVPDRLVGRATSLSQVDVEAIDATVAGYPDEPELVPAVGVPLRLIGADPDLGGSVKVDDVDTLRHLNPHMEFRRFLGVAHPTVMVRGYGPQILDDLTDFLGRVS